MKKLLTILTIIIIVLLAFMLLPKDRVTAPESENAPVANFEKSGVLTRDNPGQLPGSIYLNYEEPGQPGLSVVLTFDASSTCALNKTPVACATFTPQKGTAATVSGVKSDGTVRVLDISMTTQVGQSPGQSGEYAQVDWDIAAGLIRECKVSSVAQYHSKRVDLELKDGRSLFAQEPVIDAVFEVIQEAKSKCGTIPVATE